MLTDIKKILVVDDEVEIVKAIKRHLSRKGFCLSTASNITDAWQDINMSAQKNAPFDLVITDIAMPRGSGIELSMWIKENYPDVSVLFISGFGVKDLVLENINLKLDDFCQKPFNPDQLIDKINMISQRRKGEQVGQQSVANQNS